MASMANRDDEYDDVDLPKMTLTQRPKGYRKTKKIHSMKKGSKLRTNYQPIAFARFSLSFFYQIAATTIERSLCSLLFSH